MDFLRLFQHLLPDGRAWRTTVNKRLRQFFEGLKVIPDGVKTFTDELWSDLFPSTTEKLDDWERQFGIPGNLTDDAARRQRLSAVWGSMIGGQSPAYIQRTLRAAGFDVYVHEWWDPSTPPIPGIPSRLFDQEQCGEPGAECGEPTMLCSLSAYPTVRNPILHLRREYTKINLLVECGEALAACGEESAIAGNSLDPKGYPLVNKIFESVPDLLTLCGEELAECGEASAACGNFTEYVDREKNYIVPNDPTKWPYFLYIGGETFGELAQVDPKRRDEFEELCLRVCPAQQWLGMLIEYT